MSKLFQFHGLSAKSSKGEAQIIAPSSNDYYRFGAMAASGNALGDNTSGGNVSAIQATEALSGLITLDGNFIIAFTLVDRTNFAFGIHAHDEDDVRANNAHAGMNSMTNSFWWGIDYGTSGTQAMQGSTAEGSFTAPANNDELILRRVGGTITLENVTTATTLRTFTGTYSGTMRLAFANGTGTTGSVTDLFITDSVNTQRDGFFNETSGGATAWGDGVASSKNIGQRFKATRTGTITSVKINVSAVTTGFNAHVEIWSDDGTSPASQIGSDSSTVDLSSTGDKTFTMNTPVTKGTKYWVVLVDEGTTGSITIKYITGNYDNMGAGNNDTITSISDTLGNEWLMEIAIAATGEPTPGYGTSLLIHSNTTDGSTTFVDSSQEGRTISVFGSTQHDTAQKKFDASSILFDGSADYLTVPASSAWIFPADFTIDFWMYQATMRQQAPLAVGDTSGGGQAWSFLTSAGGQITFSISGGSALVTTSTMVVNTWYHIAVTRRADVWDIYVDGTGEATVTQSLAINDPSKALTIGQEDNGLEGFDGQLDEIRILNYAAWDDDFTVPASAYP